MFITLVILRIIDFVYSAIYTFLSIFLLNYFIYIYLCKKYKRNLKELIFIYLFILWPHVPHMEVPRPGVESELQLLAYATAMATWYLSLICDLCCSLQQCQILSPLSKARDKTPSSWILCQILNPLSHNGNSYFPNLMKDINL